MACRDFDDAENDVEGELSGHVQIEVVTENAVCRGLREDVNVCDFQTSEQGKIDDPNELRDDERGFGELFLWDALSRGQVCRRHTVELPAVLRECVCVPVDQ